MGLSPRCNYRKEFRFLFWHWGSSYLEALGSGIVTGSVFCHSFSFPNNVYVPSSWNKKTHLIKSNFLSSQMDSQSFSPYSLSLQKAKWVQLNGKTFQVLKSSLLRTSESAGAKGDENFLSMKYFLFHNM